jgi:tetratricopeptide (TPR) repeat protein
MRKIREVLRLKAGGFSKRRIAASLGISATAAMECVQRARRCGLTWPLPEDLSDDALERCLYPPSTIKEEQRPLPSWAEIHRERKRPGVNAIAFANRAYAYASKWDYDRAITDYNKVIELDPYNILVYNNRGYAYEKRTPTAPSRIIARLLRWIRIIASRVMALNASRT